MTGIGPVGLSRAQEAIGKALRAHLVRLGTPKAQQDTRVREYIASMEAANAERAAGRPSIEDSGLQPRAYLRRYGTPAERADPSLPRQLADRLLASRSARAGA